jgi:hypothetical protein
MIVGKKMTWSFHGSLKSVGRKGFIALWAAASAGLLRLTRER